jgi:uncharacterized protein (DUF885 family)
MAQQPKKNVLFNQLLNEYYEEGLTLKPLEATSIGDNRFNDILLNDISVPYLKSLHNYYVKYQKKLAAFKRSELSSFDKIAFDLMSYQIEQAFEKEKFHIEYLPVNQFRSLPNSLPSYGSGAGTQPFKIVKDYTDWLKRITAFTVWVDTAIANMDKGIKIGMVLPKALVVKVIPQLDAQTISDTAKNIFYGPVRNMPNTFSEQEKSNIRTAYVNALNTQIIPSYKKLSAYVKTVYLPNARSTSGLNALPNGTALYQYYIKVNTTTNKTPEEIYNTGLSEVDRITGEIEKLKIAIGFKGSVKELYTYTLTDKQFFPFTSDEQILDSFRAILPRMAPNLKKLFNIIPKSKFEVRAIEKFKASTSAANYERGLEDGSRPGYFNVPIIDPTKYNRLGMESLFSHEAIPGHHFQLSLQQENTDLPKIRKYAGYSVFSEGWALYTESLGDELGLYKDPLEKLAAYQSELFRAIRLVVDVGMHTGKMTREEAIKYMMEKGGRSEQATVSEIERYMANPAQALAYKTGELKIKELKAKYQKSLGAKFNIKSFHDAILLAGSMPLTVFEKYMSEWAATQ